MRPYLQRSSFTTCLWLARSFKRIKPGQRLSVLWAWPFLFLAGCSTFQSVDTPIAKTYAWHEVEPQLRALSEWSLYGKLGLRTPDDSVTAAINNWDQDDDQFEIDISSTFFGLGSSKLFGNSDFLSIIQSGEKPISSFEPDELVASVLGLPLPISHLPTWIKALPVAEQPYQLKFNEQGLPLTLQQDNWSLSFSNYHTEHSPPLPGKIKIQRDDIRIILAVKEWTPR